jgi:exonuclease SbcC
MRSGHADMAEPTEITFDFAIGSDSYRVLRYPEQERPKKRGAGTTTMTANATLWNRTGLTVDAEEGAVLATGWSKVTEVVEQLLGFKSSQFRQVVMLPQGEFRRLLTADSRERQAIMEILFQTEFYRRVEEFLKGSAKKFQSEIEQLSNQKTWVLQNAGAVSRDELEQQYRANLEQQAELKKAIEKCRLALKEAQARLETGRQVQQKLIEKESAEKALKELERNIDEIERKRSELTRANRAAGLADAENLLVTRQQEAEKAAAHLEDKKCIKNEAESACETAAKELAAEEEKGPEREAAGREVARLEALTEKVTALTAASRAVREAEKKAIEAETGQRIAQDSLDAVHKSIEENSAAYAAAKTTADQRQPGGSLPGSRTGKQ